MRSVRIRKETTKKTSASTAELSLSLSHLIVSAQVAQTGRYCPTRAYAMPAISCLQRAKVKRAEMKTLVRNFFELRKLNIMKIKETGAQFKEQIRLELVTREGIHDPSRDRRNETVFCS